MVFHTYGNKKNKAVVLIHGMLTPYQIWNKTIEEFAESHYVIVPELDGHTEDETSEFKSVEDEARKIAEYLTKELNGEVYLLAGISMGGRIVSEVAKNTGLRIENLVIDGAPLMKVNGILKSIMRNNYKAILKKSKARDPKVKASFEKNFLPGEYWNEFLKIADNISIETVDNIIDSLFRPFEFIKYPDDMKILFMHGTKGNESVSKKGALKMKELNPKMEIRSFDGLAHAELLCFKQEQWNRELREFLT